jgi:hypothetical protein
VAPMAVTATVPASLMATSRIPLTVASSPKTYGGALWQTAVQARTSGKGHYVNSPGPLEIPFNSREYAAKGAACVLRVQWASGAFQSNASATRPGMAGLIAPTRRCRVIRIDGASEATPHHAHEAAPAGRSKRSRC